MTALALAFTAYRIFDPAKPTLAAEMQRAQAQVDHGDYATGVKAFSDLIEKHPRNKALRSARVDAAMLWIRNYHIAGAEGKDIAGAANAELSPLIAMLEAESAGVGGAQAATLAAHLGWAHFLRFKIAEADMMESAEPYFRQALRLNGHDVYANSMLGNWLLQTKRDAVTEAIDCFHTAVETGEEREFVRQFELGGLLSSPEQPTAQQELVRLSNEMRKNGESIDGGRKAPDFRDVQRRSRLAGPSWQTCYPRFRPMRVGPPTYGLTIASIGAIPNGRNSSTPLCWQISMNWPGAGRKP